MEEYIMLLETLEIDIFNHNLLSDNKIKYRYMNTELEQLRGRIDKDMSTSDKLAISPRLGYLINAEEIEYPINIVRAANTIKSRIYLFNTLTVMMANIEKGTEIKFIIGDIETSINNIKKVLG